MLAPGTGPTKIFQRKCYAMVFFQAFLLDAKEFQPIKMLE